MVIWPTHFIYSLETFKRIALNSNEKPFSILRPHFVSNRFIISMSAIAITNLGTIMLIDVKFLYSHPQVQHIEENKKCQQS